MDFSIPVSSHVLVVMRGQLVEMGSSFTIYPPPTTSCKTHKCPSTGTHTCTTHADPLSNTEAQYRTIPQSPTLYPPLPNSPFLSLISLPSPTLNFIDGKTKALRAAGTF